ncbi:MAG: hypothetical protein JSW34_03130 [Candidatus Zixiibacteriota bacterium]|nr:MAG: hypothetical protein JSW34_03130 [candidate division Zixibacteria bacterium]
MKGVHVGQRGGALLIVLAIMLLLMVGALMAVKTAQTDIDLSFNQLESDQAFYVAEAGLMSAFNELNENNDWTAGYVDEPFDRGVFSVALVDSSYMPALVDTIVLRSAGSLGDANVTLEAIVVPEYWRPFQFSVFGDVSVLMDNNTCTDSYNSDSGSYAATLDLDEGDVASNGPLDFIHTAVVGGDASSATAGGISIDPNSTVCGDTASGVEPYVIQTVPDSVYDWARTVTAAPAGLSGSYTYNPTTYELSMTLNQSVVMSGGVYYFSSITLGNTVTLQVAAGEQVVIYLDGDLSVGQNGSINTDGAPGDLIIFSRGTSLDIGQSTEIYAAFYGPTVDVSMQNNSQFYGAIVCRTSSAINAACVHYDRALRDKEGGKTGVMRMIGWRQL